MSDGYTLSTRTASALLGIRHSTLSEWARQGRVPFQWDGKGRRFKFADIAALIDWQRA